MSEWLKKKKEQVKRFLLKDRGVSLPDPVKTTKPVMDKLAGINTRPISSKAKTTVGKIAGGIVETPFTFLTSVPKFYGQTMNDITSGKIKTKQGQKKTAGLALETALDTASVGLFGKAKAFAKGAKPASQTLVSLIRKSAKKGSKIGAGYGAGYGLSQGLQENRDTKSLISSTLKSGVIGGITGGGLGWGVPSGSALFKAGKHDLNVKLGKSYGKPKIVPGFERINGKLFYGRRVDPNTPQFKKTLKDVISTIPRPGMSLETVKGKGRIPVSDIRKFSKQPKKLLGMPKGYAVGDGFIMSPGSKMNTGGDFRKLFVKGGAGRDIKIRPTEFTENEFKDISSTGKGFKDVYRNIESFFGKKAPEIKKRVLVPLEQGKKQMFKNLEGHIGELERIVKMGFKKGSEMSADLQRFGEGTFTKSQVVKKYGKDKLGNFIHADRWFRKQYDKLLDEVNSVRAKIYPNQPDKIIPKRKDYYRHFQEMQEGLGALANIFEAPSGISQGLAGISQFTKPKSKWLSFAQKRMGRKTTEDATGGFINYVQQAEYAKNIDPAIVNFRKLQETITRTGEKTGQNFNNMIEFLQDYADDLAGKTNPLDRGVQKYIPGGRTMFKVLDWLNKRVKANVILGNASSSLAQIFNVPQGIASAGEKNFLKGLVRLGLSIGKDDSVMRQSTFLKERYFKGFDKFDTGILNNTKKFAAWMVTVLDELGTKSIWNAHYEKALAEKISNPINYADDITRKMVAGRGIGEVPIAQKSKLFQMVAPFQLEVTNVWHVLGDFGRNKEAGKILKFFVYSYLFNRAVERVRGSDVGLDPINALIEGVQAYNEEDDKKKGAMMATGRMAGEVLSNIPGGQTLAAMYPEYGFSVGDKNFPTRSELFGKGDPTRFGSGILIAKGIQDPISKIISPFGGVQAKRSIEGVKSFMEGSAKTKSGNVMYPVEQTPRNFLQSFAFGKYSTPQAREYFEDNRQPLGENQTKIFEMAGNDYYNKVMADRNTEAEKRKLSRKYEKDFEARSDEILKDKLSKLLVHPEFQKLSEDKKQNMIESYISKSNSLAKAQMIAEMTKGMNEEQLRAKLRELKRDGFLTKEAYDTFRKYYYQ